MKIHVTCPQCGSPDVTVDAVARWDFDQQKWDLSSVFDSRSCGSCGYEGYRFYETSEADLTDSQKAYLNTDAKNYVIPEVEHPKPTGGMYAIYREDNLDLAWSKTLHWIASPVFDLFTEEEKSNYPLPAGGSWLRVTHPDEVSSSC